MLLAADDVVGGREWWRQSFELLLRGGSVVVWLGAVSLAVLTILQLLRKLEDARVIGRAVSAGRRMLRLLAAPFRWAITDPARGFIRREVANGIEAPIADVRAQVVETQKRVAISERKVRAELATHTDEEQLFASQLVRAVVAAGAARASDIRMPSRANDFADLERLPATDTPQEGT